MTDTSAALVHGTLDMLILKTLVLEPLHGWGISQRIRQLSGGVFEANSGSLFPAFRRLERAGLLECEWRTSENNRRASTTPSQSRAAKSCAPKPKSGSAKLRPLREFCRSLSRSTPWESGLLFVPVSAPSSASMELPSAWLNNVGTLVAIISQLNTRPVGAFVSR